MQRVVVVGSINMDVVTEMEHLPGPGETLAGRAVTLLPGGKGANQAVAARRAGNDAVLHGALGTDAFAGTLRDFLRDEGLATDTIAEVDGETGTAIVLVDDEGENSIVIVPGANAAVDGRTPALREGDIVLLQNEIPEAANRAVLDLARAAGATTVLNLAPYRETDEALLTGVDHLIVNETEFARLLGEDPATMTPDRVRDLLADDVIVTLGAAGVTARIGGRVVDVAGHRVPVKDTTGAGDCFCGAFGAALARGDTVEEALRFATAAAALSVQKVGASPSMPTYEEILRA